MNTPSSVFKIYSYIHIHMYYTYQRWLGNNFHTRELSALLNIFLVVFTKWQTFKSNSVLYFGGPIKGEQKAKYLWKPFYFITRTVDSGPVIKNPTKRSKNEVCLMAVSSNIVESSMDDIKRFDRTRNSRKKG